jgi:hypothetical protein
MAVLMIVGSPPANCSITAGVGFMERKCFIIWTIWLNVGSTTYPFALALAKQMGHAKLHLLVISIKQIQGALSWFSQRPQS